MNGSEFQEALHISCFLTKQQTQHYCQHIVQHALCLWFGLSKCACGAPLSACGRPPGCVISVRRSAVASRRSKLTFLTASSLVLQPDEDLECVWATELASLRLFDCAMATTVEIPTYQELSVDEVSSGGCLVERKHKMTWKTKPDKQPANANVSYRVFR